MNLPRPRMPAPDGIARAEADVTKLLGRVQTMLAAVPGCLGAILGAAAVYIDRNQVLDPDVAGFQQLARDMALSNVFGGLREPLWPLLLVAPVHLFGSDSAIAIRFVGVLGFVWLIVASQLLIRQLFGSVWSLAGAAVAAVEPRLVFPFAPGRLGEGAAGMVMFVCFFLGSAQTD